MREFRNKIINNTLLSMIDNLFCFAIPFLLFPFIVRHLGVELGGVWFLCTAITGYFGIIDQGTGPATVKYIAENYAKKHYEEANKYISAAFIVLMCFGVIACGVMSAMAYLGDLFFKIETVPLDVFQNVFYAMGGTLLITFPLKIYNSILRGLQEFGSLALTNIGVKILQAVLIVIFLLHGYGIYALLGINFLWLMIVCLVNYAVVKVKYPEIRIRFIGLERMYLSHILSFGGVMLIINLCALLMFQTDRVILGAFLSVRSITYYAACKQIYDVCRFLPVVILQAIMPFASELKVLEKDEALNKLLLLSTKYSYALFVPIGVYVLFMADTILGVWVGNEYARYGICLQILVAHLFFNFLHQAGTPILVGTNKIKFLLNYYYISLGMNVVLSIWLVHRLQMVGVALATTIPFIIMEWMFVTRMLKALNVSIRDFFDETLVKIVFQISVVFVLMLFIKMCLPIRDLMSLILSSVFVYAVGMLSFVFTGMDRKEKSLIFSIFKFKRIHIHNH